MKEIFDYRNHGKGSKAIMFLGLVTLLFLTSRAYQFPINVQVDADSWITYLLANPQETKEAKQIVTYEIAQREYREGRLDEWIEEARQELLVKKMDAEIDGMDRRVKEDIERSANAIITAEDIMRRKAELVDQYASGVATPEQQWAINRLLLINKNLYRYESSLRFMLGKHLTGSLEKVDRLVYISSGDPKVMIFAGEEDLIVKHSYLALEDITSLRAMVIEARRLGGLPVRSKLPTVEVFESKKGFENSEKKREEYQAGRYPFGH